MNTKHQPLQTMLEGKPLLQPMDMQEAEARSDYGEIFLIQGFSTNDGPGIRTTVFTKGCPLRCLWCHNPESMHPYPELMTHDDLCIGCRKCLEVCPEKAVSFHPQKGRMIDRGLCSRCFACVEVCPAKSLTRVGETMSVDRIMAEIMKDELFFRRSQGGVTVSGGEPLLQAPFVSTLLKACKDQGLHTALDTSGYGPWAALEEILPFVDLILFDIKHMDPEEHQKGTGVDNALTLSNFRKIPGHIRLWLRLPLIPGFNDSPGNLEQVMFLSRERPVEKISLLPFNRFGDGKYLNLGRKIPLEETPFYKKEQIEAIKGYLEKSGRVVTVGE